MRVDDLALIILQQVAHGAMQHAGRALGQRGGVLLCVHALTASLHTNQPHLRSRSAGRHVVSMWAGMWSACGQHVGRHVVSSELQLDRPQHTLQLHVCVWPAVWSWRAQYRGAGAGDGEEV